MECLGCANEAIQRGLCAPECLFYSTLEAAKNLTTGVEGGSREGQGRVEGGSREGQGRVKGGRGRVRDSAMPLGRYLIKKRTYNIQRSIWDLEQRT